MTNTSRRTAFKALLAGAASAPFARGAEAAATSPTRAPRWSRGIEGQRKADLGDGSYPTVLKDGNDYY